MPVLLPPTSFLLLHVYTCVCMCVYTTCIHIYMCVCVYTCIHAHACIHDVYMDMCPCIYAFMHVRGCVCVCACAGTLFIHARTCIHVYIHVHILRVHACMYESINYINLCICLSFFIPTWNFSFPNFQGAHYFIFYVSFCLCALLPFVPFAISFQRVGACRPPAKI
jgi:hypothetical protein